MLYLADTVTKLSPEAEGSVLVCGSHGGIYPAYLAAKAQVRAVIFNDAGVGKDRAGIASLDYLLPLGVPAATVSNFSCRIGDTPDMINRGTISHVNALAAELGVEIGDECGAAAEKLSAAAVHPYTPGTIAESRKTYTAPGERRIILIDSASLVLPEDRGQIVVTASHGGLVGGKPEMALRVDAFAAVFHDAGVGVDDAGITRLPALDGRGIAALTVSASSARIGDALSVCEEGVISYANAAARRIGAQPGEQLLPLLRKWSLLV